MYIYILLYYIIHIYIQYNLIQYHLFVLLSIWHRLKTYLSRSLLGDLTTKLVRYMHRYIHILYMWRGGYYTLTQRIYIIILYIIIYTYTHTHHTHYMYIHILEKYIYMSVYTHTLLNWV